MGERKVLNKYIPADFDPTLIPRGKKLSKKDGTVPVRMMLPFSVQCSACNTFLYRGRKFNSKKEPMGGPDGRYLGIQRWRFYIKCTHCSRTVSFLTDPKNADYEMESGGTRNYEVYKDKEKTEGEAVIEKEEEEKIDPMKALENRVLDSQREMADLDNLEEIRAMNRRHAKLLSNSGEGFDADAKAVMKAREVRDKLVEDIELNEHGITEEEESLIKKIKFGQAASAVKRLNEEDEMLEEKRRQREVALMKRNPMKPVTQKTAIPKIKVKRKKKVEVAAPSKKAKAELVVKRKPPAAAPSSGGLAGLLGDYGSESD
ncbi:unnamed protein product [Cylindrotheca closterium]|uniref:Splicing factor YJU2 n=1 Tax=Cylindrotheca closterium TaxID=2856 RepID=A0AAD2CRW3_9STRA|nr:unnamed protein product [Cylindrotheca closterium]